MIKSFKNETTALVFSGKCPKGFPDSIFKVARRKLRMLDAAVALIDLRSPPGNHLEKMKGDREGQNSIRINDQFRICFRWTKSGAENVEITDYHRG